MKILGVHVSCLFLFFSGATARGVYCGIASRDYSVTYVRYGCVFRFRCYFLFKTVYEIEVVPSSVRLGLVLRVKPAVSFGRRRFLKEQPKRERVDGGENERDKNEGGAPK